MSSKEAIDKLMKTQKENEINEAKAELKKFSNILKEEEKSDKKKGEELMALSPEDFTDWLIDLHNSYIEFLNYTYEQDWLNSTEMQTRFYIANYVMEIVKLFSKFEIDELPEGVVEILIEKIETELLLILHVLNYI